MKRFISFLAAVTVTVCAFAQKSELPVIMDIIELEDEMGGTAFSVFNMKVNGVNNYYLNMGQMGIGDRDIQINLDPASVLYIPLGNTLNEAIATLESMKELFKQPKESSMVVQGCLTVGFPKDNLEPVTVTYRKPLLEKQLEFTLERRGYLRAKFISKSEFGSLVSGTKFHKKLYPKE